MAVSAREREVLIKTLWPDKAVYGAIMLFMTGFLGLLYAGLQMVSPVEYSNQIPKILRDYPAWITAVLSAATVVLALMALRGRRTDLALGGAVAGVAAMAVAGLGALLSLVAVLFVFLSRKEGEDVNPATLRLTPEMWPDKTLAASMLMLMSGVSLVLWGSGILAKWIVFTAYVDQVWAFGAIGVATGVLCLVAAYLLYYQKGKAVGYAAALLAIPALGFAVITPVLGLATLALLLLAGKEREFEGPHSSPRGA